MWSNARSEALEVALPAPIDVQVVRTAKRMRLRYDDATGRLKLTCPPRTDHRTALAWAVAQRAWIEAQVARALPAEPFVSGAAIPLEGAEVVLEWNPCASRNPVREANCLRCGGPERGFARRIETWLRTHALDIMSREVADYAETAGVAARSVSIGDAGSRWGSCSSQGRIRLNWRLILAPPDVRRYVVAHEVAHLVHLNHGPEFKILETRLFGTGVAFAKAELRRLGPRLRRIGRRN